MRTDGRVLSTVNGHESKITDGRIPEAARVGMKRRKTDGRVLGSRRIAIECVNTVGRIIDTSGVQRQRINADGRVVSAAGVTFERRETNCRIVYAAGETQKGVLPFRRVASAIAAVRWRTYSFCFWQESDAEESNCCDS